MDHSIKLNRAINKSGAFGGTQTLDKIMSAIPDDLRAKLTSGELATVITIVTAQYHAGRAACNAEIIDGDAVWIGAGVDRLIPLAAIRAINIERIEDQVKRPSDGVNTMYGHSRNADGTQADRASVTEARGKGYFYYEHQSTTRYTLDFTEKF